MSKVTLSKMTIVIKDPKNRFFELFDWALGFDDISSPRDVYKFANTAWQCSTGTNSPDDAWDWLCEWKNQSEIKSAFNEIDHNNSFDE